MQTKTTYPFVVTNPDNTPASQEADEYYHRVCQAIEDNEILEAYRLQEAS